MSEKQRNKNDSTVLVSFGCRNCSSPSLDTCLTFSQKEGLKEKFKVRVKFILKKNKSLSKWGSFIFLIILKTLVSAVKAEAKALIKKFFSRVQRCERETDWKHLKRPHGSKATESKE